MKKLYLIFIVFSSLFATPKTSIGTQIMEKISVALTYKDSVKILVQNKDDLIFIKNSLILKRVDKCEEADIILVKNAYELSCKNNPLIFATSYLGFKNTPSVLGAFYYQKGRPNLILKEEKLKLRNIKLSKEFDRYIE